MRDKLKKYVESLFADASDSPRLRELRDEIMGNTLSRYDDQLAAGKTELEAYNTAILSIGDVDSLLETYSERKPESAAKQSANPLSRFIQSGNTLSRRITNAIAVALYITCVVPVIILSSTSWGEILGICLMFGMIAAATALLITGGKSLPLQKIEKIAVMPRNKAVGIAVPLYILCVLPPIFFDMLSWCENIGPGLMFIMIAIATALLIINSGSAQYAAPESQTLYADETPAIPAMPEKPKKEQRYPNSTGWKIFMAVYWMVTSLLFLQLCNWGFVLVSWVVFPLAGSAVTMIRGVMRLLDGRSGAHEIFSGLLWIAVCSIYLVASYVTSAWAVTWLIFLIGAALSGVLSGIFTLAKGEKV
ncbi:MAG: permease prefix domain 1-containing protein [Oscillospiraceae bacterium]|jgi:hypothetical protein|nr:permease prefix domain 1-containing protein [Oscillospiraceae bacterium]